MSNPDRQVILDGRMHVVVVNAVSFVRSLTLIVEAVLMLIFKHLTPCRPQCGNNFFKTRGKS